MNGTKVSKGSEATVDHGDVIQFGKGKERLEALMKGKFKFEQELCV